MGESSSVTVRSVDPAHLDVTAAKTLFNRCGWDWLNSDVQMLDAFKKSYRLFCAFDQENLIGFGRVLSDGSIYAFLVDMIVDPDYRNRGVGNRLVQFITDSCRNDGVKILKLISSKEGLSLYKKAGFLTCPDESPGMIKFLYSKSDG
jgi:ribosomal protein S18 acetylase RimI-like enzyme